MRALWASLLPPLFLLLLLLALPLGVVVTLNTGAGRQFAEQELNHYLAPQLSISGLAGHFPADIKISSLTLADKGGPWLTGQTLELRWNPLKLLHRDVAVSVVSARSVSVLRLPLATPSRRTSSVKLPNFRLDVETLSVRTLNLGAPLAGQATTLTLTGSAHLENLAGGTLALDAATPDGTARYQLTGQLDPKNIALNLHLFEPPNGPLGHFLPPKLQNPLVLALTLAGPRDNAALNLATQIGATKLLAMGAINLNQRNADVVLSLPALAPLTAGRFSGGTKLHLLVTGAQNLSLTGSLGLTAAPNRLAALIGPRSQLSLLASLQGKTVNIQNFNFTGADLSLNASGQFSADTLNLTGSASIPQFASLSPGTSGPVQADVSLTGSPQDFAVAANVTGHLMAQKLRSGPFNITLNAQNLPRNLSGTLTGSGALEGAPLQLDAAFTRTPDGTTHLAISHAAWRSLTTEANLTLAPNATLPIGAAQFTLQNLSDFQSFSPVPLSGSVTGTFAYPGGKTLALALTARNLLVIQALGRINATLHANGPIQALAVSAEASLARLYESPAQLAFSGVLDLNGRAATLSTFTGSWRQLNATLLAPARITTWPEIALQHLALELNGGRIGLEGTLSPHLRATATLQDFPASLAQTFDPALSASGLLNASADLTGTLAAPAGRLTLAAQSLKFRTGPAAALAPANLTARATLSHTGANVDIQLAAGPNLALAASGLIPFSQTGPVNLHVTGRADLRLLDPIIAVQGDVLRGIAATDLTLTGSLKAPRASGRLTLADGSAQNIASGLNLSAISASLLASGSTATLQNFQATAGQGRITAQGTLDLGAPDMPLALTLTAANATPISSDLFTETLDANLSLKGALRRSLALSGNMRITKANINIPKSLPPDVPNLPIIIAGAPPAPPPPAPLPLSLDLTLTAANQIFVRGDGLFAELGGRLRITGTAADPTPLGGFELIRGTVSLTGKTLQFTQGTVSFTGEGFVPALDLEVSSTNNNITSTLIVGGTAAKPTITLTSTPPLPSDEILAQLLFGESTTNLSPFQAASLAAALAQLSGVGGNFSPLDTLRSALGLDELSLSGSGSGPPSVQAGRYVSPGIYVGASQATNGQGTQVNVQINLYKGLKLQTATGTSGTGSGDSSSAGLTYQFNY